MDLSARAAEVLSRGDRTLNVHGLEPVARAALAAEIAAAHDALVWIVTSDLRAARRLHRDIETFLEARGEPRPVHVVPPWAEPPDGRLSPDAAPTFERLGALAAARVHERAVLVVPVEALFQKVLPPETLDALCLTVRPGDATGWDPLLDHLASNGYVRTERVEAMGEFSVRGGVVDCFPPDAAEPVRIELWGDDVESIRRFDMDTQRSTAELDHVLIGPCREVLFTPDTVARSAIAIKHRSDELGVPKPTRDALVDTIREGLRAPGIEAYLPAFFEDRVPVAAYAEGTDPVLVDRPIESERIWSEQLEKLAARDAGLAETEQLYFPAADFWDLEGNLESFVRARAAICFDGLDDERGETIETSFSAGEAPVPRDVPGADGFTPIAARFTAWLEAGVDPVVAASSDGQAARLEELFAGRDLPVRRAGIERLPTLAPSPEGGGTIHLVVATLSGGFRWPSMGRVLVTDEEIFGPKRHTRRSRTASGGPALSLSEVTAGDRIVHRDFGIGLFQGLKTLSPGGVRQEFLQLEYAGGDRLYLPVDRIELVERYVGGGDSDSEHGPKLSKLGGPAWERTRKRIREQVLEMATQLANLYAARQLVHGHAFAPPDSLHHEFAAAFPFDETPDQAEAIDAVLADMSKDMVMDRLVCGDVGYGKTEVAMRAAFLAVLDRKQVAVLVPTTVLAQQHYQSFLKRFEGQAVRIEMVSRFRKPAEVKEALHGLARGTVDIVIGTHRLLSPGVRFRQLGLAIIDEEHRFGVAQKERLRRLRTQADVISLTATPIPRTLNMSLSGLRDLSIIATPPEDRQAIRTYISRYDGGLISEVIRRELTRGGQVFFVHNRVQTMAAMADELEKLVPEAKVAVAHGQMSATDLERAMVSFVRGESHILLTSAIIESGLDIPNANTMLINRADRFGLAQLYQLRGRVGRGSQQAYTYLLIPDERRITKDAVRRLEVLRGLTDLGAGFRLALEDLEIRGAGNLLGKDQSGHVAAVGFDLYQEMVKEAMAELEGHELELDLDPEIHFTVEAYVPESYVPDTAERLVAYRQIARARNDQELDDIRFEWIDRFGKLPQETAHLFVMMGLKCEMRRAGAVLARQAKSSVAIQFHERARVASHKVTVQTGDADWRETITLVRRFLEQLRS